MANPNPQPHKPLRHFRDGSLPNFFPPPNAYHQGNDQPPLRRVPLHPTRLTLLLPPSLSHPTHRQSSHLWLTTATNTSVRISTPHLVAFVEGLNAKYEIGHKHDESENSARRKLVVLCLDEGCLNYCREKTEWYCFGGFEKEGGEGSDEERGERVKIKATVEALESGRRVFLVDPDVYFKEDPVPYLGALQHYDMQIPDSWHSGRLNAGFAFLQPTQNIISLWRRLLIISLLPPKERRLWSTTNLLLDPFGQARDHRNPHSKAHSKQFSEEDDAVASGYGQTEFESTWAGGLM
ncbi:hypothetical protein BCR35DRAFT_194981 [Leucosporidium creatinivorum]|uniref:Nucleotide-diphospho-sugar transferase domain-containing protein n=1 Tax=Leucosporidium creatinivorum TaxID=106004 RepID=A0A1Y2DU03_9BASI|nr:hypothetical protein BCR35DRAFT_194981 [Leucosporidium creatinivorum]